MQSEQDRPICSGEAAKGLSCRSRNRPLDPARWPEDHAAASGQTRSPRKKMKVKHAISLAAAVALIGCESGCPSRQVPVDEAEHVILLHGLARSPRSMARMERALIGEGYAVTLLGYPSRKKSIEALAEQHLSPAVAESLSKGPARIHFVTHSLGGIVLRQYLRDHPLPKLGRIVMLGPPNRGSEVVDRLGDWKIFKAMNGPAGLQLGTSRSSIPNVLPEPQVDIGIVAGTRSINWILSMLIPGTDDGKVSVERTKLGKMTDFVTAPTPHPFLMQDPDIIEMTLRFLRTGRFCLNQAAPEDLRTDGHTPDPASLKEEPQSPPTYEARRGLVSPLPKEGARNFGLTLGRLLLEAFPLLIDVQLGLCEHGGILGLKHMPEPSLGL